ncbi:GtrA family protein [Halorubrum xinjiangense]|uniref:GtrA family protein n=1 Tax=Halorubrum xinjiangense TaxID=261291 RepID=UPI003C6EB02B
MTQFVSVGAVGAVLETIIVAVLTTTVAFQPLLAKAIGAEVSISTMFALNDRYTFAGEGALGTRNVVRRWVKSHAVRATGLTVAFVILWYLTARTEIRFYILGADVWPTIANVIGIGAALTINYVAESVITWNVAKREL